MKKISGITNPSCRRATLRPSSGVGLRLFQSKKLLRPERFVMDLRRGLDEVLQVCPRKHSLSSAVPPSFRPRKPPYRVKKLRR